MTTSASEDRAILYYWADLHDAAARAAEVITRRLADHVRDRFDFLAEHFPGEVDEVLLTMPPSVKFEGRLSSASLVGIARGDEVVRVTWNVHDGLSSIALSCEGVPSTGLAALSVFPRRREHFPRMAQALANRAAEAIACRINVHPDTWRAA